MAEDWVSPLPSLQGSAATNPDEKGGWVSPMPHLLKDTSPVTGLADLMTPKAAPPEQATPPITPLPGSMPRSQASTEEPASRGLLGDLASSIARGVVIRLPEQLGHVVKGIPRIPEALGFYGQDKADTGDNWFQKVGDTITNFTEEYPKTHPFFAPSKEEALSVWRRGLTGTFENAPSSLTPMFTGFLIGSALGPVGSIAGGLIGGGLATMATFGLSSYNQTYEDAIKAGKDKGEAISLGRKIGLIEGGIEALTDPLEMALPGPGRLASGTIKETIRSMLRMPLKATIKDTLLKIAPIETGTEMLQDWWEANILKKAGMETPEPGQALKEAILPSIGMSILFGAGTHAMNVKQRNQIYKLLTDPNADPNQRVQAALAAREYLKEVLPKEDEDLVNLWDSRTANSILSGKGIDLDSDFIDFLNKQEPTPGPESTAPGAVPPQAPPSPVPPTAPEATPPAPGPAPPSTPGVTTPPVVPPGVPPGVTTPPAGPTTPGVTPPPPAAPSPAPPAPVKPPAPAQHLGGPEWLKIGGEVEFYDKDGNKRKGSISNITYEGDPPTPNSLTVTDRSGKILDLKPNEVNEPQRAIRQREYTEALANLSSEKRKEVRGQSRTFDDLLIKNAELFVEPGMIDYFYEGATTDRKRAIAAYNVLNEVRGEAGKALGIKDVYNPVTRSENLQALKDHIASKGGASEVDTQAVAAGLLPQGKRTVKKDGHWWNVSFDEETGQIVMKDGKRITVSPDDKIQVEQIKSPKEAEAGLPNKTPEGPATGTPSAKPNAGAAATDASPVPHPKEEPTPGPAPEKPATPAAAPEKPAAPPSAETVTPPAPAEKPSSPVVAPVPKEGANVPKNETPEAPKPPIEAPGKEGEPATPPVAQPPVAQIGRFNPQTPIQKLAVLVSQRIETILRYPNHKDAITQNELMARGAEAFGGTRAEGKFTPREAYDALECGVNIYLMEHENEINLDLLNKITSILPTMSIRTEDMQKFQQFSTPPAISYAANWLAKVDNRDVFAETSAGNGGLAVMADKENPKLMILNELAKDRVENLKFLFPEARVFNENAEHANSIIGSKLKADEKPTVAVINPPFSASGGRMPGKKILDIVNLHINQALQMLEPNGRLVVITGRGFAPDSPTFKEYFNQLKSEYNVRANIGLDGKNYKKYGTSFDIRMTVIDKAGPTQGEVYARDFVTPEEMLNDPKLQEIRNGRPEIQGTATAEQSANQPVIEAGHEDVGEKPGTGRPVLAPATNVQPGLGTGGATEAGNVSVGGSNEQTQAPTVTGLPGNEPGGRGEIPGSAGPGTTVGAPGVGGENIGQTGNEHPNAEPGIPPAVPVENQIAGVTVPEKTELKDDKVYQTAQYPKQDMGGEHPTKLVEPVALVDIQPPDVSNVNLNLTLDNLKGDTKGSISSDQIFIAKLAKRAHSLGLAFFNAGGTGSGKGLGNAATLMDAWNSGKKKLVWMSQTKDLQADARRDWKMMGGKDSDIIEFSKIKNNVNIEDHLKAKNMPNQGILFLSYGLLAMPEGKNEGSMKRIDQVLNWLGKDFDGVIVFDEAHNMANALPVRGARGAKAPSQRALAGLDLQDKMPAAKVIYSSATGATELANLAYAQGLKIWGTGTSFADVYDFLGKVAPHQTAGLEMVAADLKRMGLYLAPSISFEGVTMEKLTHELSPEQSEMYNTVARQWQTVLHNMHAIMAQTGANKNASARRNAGSIFWGAQQRFFSQMLLAMQMPSVVAHAKEEIAKGNSPVFQLVNTNAAPQERILARMSEDQDYEEVDLSPKEILMSYLEKAFPTGAYEEYTDDNGNIKSRPVLDSEGNHVQDPAAVAARDNLLADLGGMKFPENPLDFLIKEIGQDNISEVTGRKERLVWKENKRSKEKRSDADIHGEVQDFYDDKRRALVFSGKGSTGFSFDSDKSFQNQRKRIHYLVQAGWRADQVFQGLGRTHRANEVTPPHIVRSSINVPSAQRFDASIARRLEQMGALSKGQRQTTSQGLFNARENLENAQAREALDKFYRDLMAGAVPGISMAEFANQTGLKMLDEQGQLLENLPPIQQFLNRMLSMELDPQRITFDHFSHLMDMAIESAERTGRLDLGLRNLHALKTEMLSNKVVHTDQASGANTNLMHIQTTHEAPIFTYKQMTGWAEGVMRNVKSGKIWAMGKVFNRTKSDGSVERVHPLRSANYTSEYINAEDMKDKKKWVAIPRDQLQAEWEKAVDTAPKTMTRDHYMITGMKLPIWDRMGTSGSLWRFQTPDGKMMVGKEIHPSELKTTLKNLNAEIDAIKMTSQDVFENVMDSNKVVKLSNEWKFRRTKSQGEERLELIGPDTAFHNSFRQMGVAIEMIDFKTRYFIPTEKEKAISILDKLLLNRPITEVGDRGSNKVFGSMPEEPGYTAPWRTTGTLPTSAGTTLLSEEWKGALLPDKSYMAVKAAQFLASRSPVSEDRTLIQAFLSNPGIRKQLENLPIVTFQNQEEMMGEHNSAFYNIDGNNIGLAAFNLQNRTPEMMSGTMTEEIVHALTHNNMNDRDRNELDDMVDKAKLSLTEDEQKKLRSIGGYNPQYLQSIGMMKSPVVYYALSNRDELLASAIRYLEVREFLKSIPEAQGINKPKNLWDRFVRWMNNVLFRNDNQEHRTLLNQVLEKAGELMQKGANAEEAAQRQMVGDQQKFYSLDDPPMPNQLQDNLDAVTDPHLSNKAAADPNFMSWLHQKMGILHIPGNDLGVLEQYLSLPYYLSKKYPVFGKLLNTQTNREELRSDGINQFLQASQPFLTLKGPEVQKIEKALSEGDKEKAVYTEDQLRERFGLSNTGMEAYSSVRTTLDSMLNRWADHAEWALMHPYEKRLTGEEYQQLLGIYKKVLTPDEISALPPKVANAYNRLQPGVNLIKKIRGRVAELKGYFPRYREPGKYYVAVKEKQTDAQGNESEVTTFTTFANSEWEATKIVNNLKEEKEPNETIMYGRHVEEPESSFFGTSDTNLQRLVDNSIQGVKKEGQITEQQALELRHQLSQSLAEMLLARGSGARMIKRSKNLIGGYQTDQLQQVLKNYIVGYMGMETKQDAAYEFLERLGDVPKNQPQLFGEASHYVDSMLRNYDKQDQKFSKVRALAFTYYLAGSIRAAAIQMTQNFVTGIPFLSREMKGQGKGLFAAERYHIRAMKDIAIGKMTEEEKFMDHEVISKGIANDQLIRSITAEIGGATNQTMFKVSQILAAPFSKMEIFNRRSAALARYRLAQEQGLNFEQSLEKVTDFIYNTHYLMTKANLPHAARSGDLPSKLIGTAYTFRRFTHNYILSMIYSLRGPDGKFNLKNVDVFMHSLAWIVVFGGLSSLPFLDDLLDEAEKFFGRPYRQEIRNWLTQVGGQPLERAGVAGLPALLGQIPGMVGVDISGSLRIGLPRLTDPMQGAKETVFGVWGGMAQKAASAYQAASVDDYMRAFEFASPVMLENILKATRMSTMGATTPQGKTMFDPQGKPIKETPGEAVGQVLGFRPERIAGMSEERRTFKNVETYFLGKRTDLYTQFRLAKTSEDRQGVIKDVQKYNLEASKYRGSVPLINAEGLRRAVTEKPEKDYRIWGLQQQK